MPHFGDILKEVMPKSPEGKGEARAAYSNPDKLILPKGLEEALGKAVEIAKDRKFGELTDSQRERIEAYTKFLMPAQERFEGERGNSLALPDETMITGPAAKEWLDTHGLKGIEYRNGFPDFSSIAVESVTIPQITADRPHNFHLAYTALARKWNESKRDGKTDWKDSDAKQWAKDNGLTVHEKEDLKTCEFVPTCVHAHYSHVGGACIAAVAGIFSDMQIAAGIADRRSFYDQFDS